MGAAHSKGEQAMSSNARYWGIALLSACLSLGAANAADNDGDGVDDLVDVCPNTPPGIIVDVDGRPLGDLDGDCDVDVDDFQLFQGNVTGPLAPPEICNDGIDNDGDGLADCLDPDCDERPCGPYDQICIAFTCDCPFGHVELCDDGVDNDCDGLVDCEDPDCDGQPCGPNGLVCAGSTCACPSMVEICDDNIDNDCDGLIDCMDPDCEGFVCGPSGQVCQAGNCVCPGSVEICDDGIDNDCDGLIDCEDVAGCPSGTACGPGQACTPIHTCECQPPYADCDGNPLNGCEQSLDTNPQCFSATFLGSVSGDDGVAGLSQMGAGEHWYRVTVAEDDDSFFDENDLGITVQLTSPPGTDYDLYLYCDCASLADSSTNHGNTLDVAQIGWDDNVGADDGQNIFIKVEYFDGDSCASYHLEVLGNTSAPQNCSF
jgi:hypothetical protein